MFTGTGRCMDSTEKPWATRIPSVASIGCSAIKLPWASRLSVHSCWVVMLNEINQSRSGSDIREVFTIGTATIVVPEVAEW